jgi:hypothetical protein
MRYGDLSATPRTVVKNTLEANGFGWIDNRALDPVDDWEKRQVLHSRTAIGLETDPFVPALASYEFRKLLRHLIGSRGELVCDLGAVAKKLGQTTDAVERSFTTLLEAGLLIQDGPCYRFPPNVDNLGPTVEWYVADLFNARLHWAATTNVLLEDTEYNDFDVIAVHGSEIAHVECKTSAPTKNGIPDEDLAALVGRHFFLQPTFTLGLVDTSSPVQDLANRLDQVLVQYVQATGAGTGMAPAARFEPVEEGTPNVLHSWRNIYVGNASAGATNGLLRTLRLTLRHYSTRVRWAGIFA